MLRILIWTLVCIFIIIAESRKKKFENGKILQIVSLTDENKKLYPKLFDNNKKTIVKFQGSGPYNLIIPYTFIITLDDVYDIFSVIVTQSTKTFDKRLHNYETRPQ